MLLGLLPILAALAMPDEPTDSGPRISLHLTPADTPACELDPGELSCDRLVTSGNAGTKQYLYVLLSGVDQAFALEFGLDYDEGVRLGQWIPCAGGMEHAIGNFPEPATGMGILWGRCVEPMTDDGLIIVGCVEILPDSWGRVWVAHPDVARDGRVEICVGGTRPTVLIQDPHTQGMVRVHGVHPGRVGCN